MELWVEVFLAGHKSTDKLSDHTVEESVLHLVTVFKHVHEAQSLQLSVAANSGEYMILYGRRGAYLEMLDVTHLLDRPVVLFDLRTYALTDAVEYGCPKDVQIGNPAPWFVK